MTIADVAAVPPLSDFDHRAQLRRAVIASTVGMTIEWYDFLLYGQMAALVFAKLYFPSSDPLTGVLQAFAVFAVGFGGNYSRVSTFLYSMPAETRFTKS
jgi:hypothetical protein